MTKERDQYGLEELEWVQLRHDMDESGKEETQKDKLIRKITENPLVPIGCLATTAALSVGLWSFRHGNREMSQYMMRARVVAQGFTVFAMLLGVTMGFASKPERRVVASQKST